MSDIILVRIRCKRGIVMYKVCIVEDIREQRKILAENIVRIFEEAGKDVEVISFSCGEDLLGANIDNIDIFFLDIDLNKLSGMDIARIIRSKEIKAEIIFTTSLIDYIQDGYKVRAYRYLLKPISYKNLKEAIRSCIKDIAKYKRFIRLNYKNVNYNISINEILYIEVIRKDLYVYTEEREYLAKNTISNLENELKGLNFFRCHKSYIINLEKIQSLTRNTIYINNNEIPVSKYRVKNLRDRLADILGDIIC